MERTEKPRVLVVDDEKTVCESVSKILVRRGLEVEEAYSAQEALEKLETAPEAFGTALVDLVMPQINGIQLLQVIKSRYPSIPVIIITGYPSIESAVRTTKLGAIEYIAKPFTPAQITDATEKAIERYYQAQKEMLTKDQARKQAKIDVDVPYDPQELEKYTSPLYVESATRTDIPIVTRTLPTTYRIQMKLQEIKEILDCQVLTGENGLDEEIGVVCGADLMSDVLTFIKPGALLLSGVTNAHVVRTAELADIKAIVFVRGKRPLPETIKLAREKKIPLLSTELLMYEACGRLYRKGLKGGSEI